MAHRTDIKSGIQFAPNGELQGFWVAREHPGGFTTGATEYDFVPSINAMGLPAMVFYFDPCRESASREIPWLHRALALINDSGDYKDSELKRKQMEADIGIILKLNDPASIQDQMEADTTFGNADDNGSQVKKVASSQVPWPKRQVFHLEANESADVVNADRPGEYYEPFLRSHDRDIGMAVGRSFERASNNYGAANFSATRVSGIEDNVEYETEFRMFSEGLLVADWEWTMWGLSIETANPIFRMVEPRYQRYIKPSWDGLRDAKASTERIMSGISSVPAEAAGIGHDWEEQQDQQLRFERREEDERERLGLDKKPPGTLNDPKVIKKPPKAKGGSQEGKEVSEAKE
jgi:capsid protein